MNNILTDYQKLGQIRIYMDHSLKIWYIKCRRNTFSRWRPWQPSWITHRNNFSQIIFTSHLDAACLVSSQWIFRFMRNGFSRWQPSWISDQKKISYCFIYKSPDASYQVSSELVFWFRKRSDQLAFPFGTILGSFDLQVTPMLPIKFQVNWLFSSREEAKNNFKMAAIAAILDFRSERFELFFIYK